MSRNMTISRRRFLRTATAASAFAAWPRVAQTRRREWHPNIVLLSIDSLRPDHLSCYGYPQPTSPHIDAVAREGYLFTNAVSTTTWTLPAHISMLTGLYPDVHGVVGENQQLNPKAPICTEFLQAQGYHSAGFVSGPYLSSEYGFARGFDLYDDFSIRFAEFEQATAVVTSPRLHAQVLPWLTANHAAPFFLFVHYWDVHYDYVPPAPFDSLFDPDYTGPIDGRDVMEDPRIRGGMDPRDLQHLLALYDGEIAFTDRYVGKLLDHLRDLGVYENTLIVITADHGDEFLEHGCKGHEKNLFDETLKVPLIVRLPERYARELAGALRPVGATIPEQVSLIDLPPTFRDLLGFAVDEVLDGQSLLPLLVASAASGAPMRERFPRRVFADLHERMSCMRSNVRKYIRIADRRMSRDEFPFCSSGLNGRRLQRVLAAAPEGADVAAGPREAVWLLDLLRDPAERVNLALEEPALAVEEHRILIGWLEEAHRRAAEIGRLTVEHSDGLREELRSLGYIR